VNHRSADVTRRRRGSLRGVPATIALGCVLALAQPALAADLSQAEFAGLADAAAGGDPGALEELRLATSIDGRPYDVAEALDGAGGPELESRLRELAAAAAESPPEGASDPVSARLAAEEILADPPPVPQTGDSDGGAAPGIDVPMGLAIVVGALALAAGAMAARTAARMPAAERARTGGGAGARTGDPDNFDVLERRAREAEERGDHASAVRLRFEAGLLRLDRAGSLRLRPSLTAGTAAREAGAPSLAPLAAGYEGIAFGGRPASEADSAAQREGWRRVLEEVRGR
jgi:hypothetical protein